MAFPPHDVSRRMQRKCSRLLGSGLLAITLLFGVSGCSSLFHKSPLQEQLPTNPWIKPAKPETFGQKVKGIFWKEKKIEEPKDWLGLKRPN